MKERSCEQLPKRPAKPLDKKQFPGHENHLLFFEEYVNRD
jgi:hypothetical protein